VPDKERQEPRHSLVPDKDAQEQRPRSVPNQKQCDKTGDMDTKKKKEKNAGQRHFFHREVQMTKELPYDEASPATSEARDYRRPERQWRS